MEVVSSFEIPTTPGEAWELLLDVPRVIPCMPGAELVEAVDEDTWKARLSTKLGPVSLGFDADVSRTSIDPASHTVTLATVARERSGRGAATATITSRLAQEDGATVAHVTTDLALTGAVARFGRQGLVRDVAAQMTDQFAANLRRELQGAGAAPASGPGGVETPPPVAGRSGPLASAGPVPRAPEEPSAARMIAGILLRAVIRRLEGVLARIERSHP